MAEDDQNFPPLQELGQDVQLAAHLDMAAKIVGITIPTLEWAQNFHTLLKQLTDEEPVEWLTIGHLGRVGLKPIGGLRRYEILEGALSDFDHLIEDPNQRHAGMLLWQPTGSSRTDENIFPHSVSLFVTDLQRTSPSPDSVPIIEYHLGNIPFATTNYDFEPYYNPQSVISKTSRVVVTNSFARI